MNSKSISIRDSKKVIFYILKIYFIYFTISFYKSPNIPVSIFINNSLILKIIISPQQPIPRNTKQQSQKKKKKKKKK